jgi:hypothetical protein
MVYSIEPEPTLAANAKNFFSNIKNIEIINGTSESVLPDLLKKIKGDINFWLDGHYSAGVTFKGKSDTPIMEELAAIGEHRSHLGKITVLVDDIRCFNPHLPEYAAYPPVTALTEWAQQNGLRWHIEHDIFVAKNY